MLKGLDGLYGNRQQEYLRFYVRSQQESIRGIDNKLGEENVKVIGKPQGVNGSYGSESDLESEDKIYEESYFSLYSGYIKAQ